jgi:hypothetical protein
MNDVMAALTACAVGLGVGWLVRHRPPTPAPDPDAKFCRDCRWAKPRSGGSPIPSYQYAVCMHPSSVQNTGDLLASGRYNPDNMWRCSTMRSERYADKDKHCGPQGTHWEPKQ